MKSISRIILFMFVMIIAFSSCRQRSGKPRVLIFTKTAGFHHSSIPLGIAAITKLGAENNFETDTTSDASLFTEDSLKKYSAVVFLCTTGDLLNNYQEADFQRYIQAGGGYVGIHAATDAEYDWGWYGRLAGGYFNGHPSQQEAVIQVIDSTDASTKHLPKLWKRKDEWYNFKKLANDLHILLKIDEKSYEGGTNNGDHPMAWYHEFDGGRAWYTELGHTDESYSEPNYLKHILGGIQYAIGKNQELDYSKAKQLRVPEEDRFTKTTLAEGAFFEPTEMTILPNLDILVTQRRGEILLYSNTTKSVKQAGFLNVYFKTKTSANAEEGLLGIQADPDFAKNHYVYMFYSPVDTSVNRLSRFKFENDTIDPKSEKVVLQFYSQREICCHTGGSIAFGDDHLLYVSAGDNSTPFEEPNEQWNTHAFGPLDDRPGHLQYDARRSSSNTNDLRGKILRIKIKEDGTYDIPDGNLFPKGTDKTRPEIYVMGDRNPYRISIDKKTGFLYWGEVGPDASNDSLETRGPRGYDELNQARKAGYFGWPLFVGNNYPYHAYDYSNGKTGPAFDPQKPINDSRNNTGLRELPPVSPAFIWYPYAESKEFPQVGTGGRTAMAGPVYHSELYPDSVRMPDYYNDKLMFYEWIRGWIKPVTMLPNGDFDKMEPFMEHTKFNSPIDMEMGPDGRMYILEYGSGWFSKNADAGLVRIDYNPGNRPAHINGITIDKTSGDLPLDITVKVDAKDPENDKLTYVWDLGNGVTKETNLPTLTYTLTKAGDYAITVQVKDDKGATATSHAVNVYAGNLAPTVNIDIKGNKTFYFPGKAVNYSIAIDDKDDTSKIKDLGNLVVSADYVEGSDQAAASQGHQVMSEAVMGKNLMLTLDCKSCHKVAEKSVGPAFEEVSKKYQKDQTALTRLTQKIIKGGSGVWGEVAMAAHPNLKEADAQLIVKWVLSLAATAKPKSLPAAGSLNATNNKPVKDNGVLYLTALYSDKGGNNIKPLSGSASVALRNNKVTFESINKRKEFGLNTSGDVAFLTVPDNTGWFALENIDLSNIAQVELGVDFSKSPIAAYQFELHLDAPDGKKIGELNFPAIKAINTDNKKHQQLTLKANIETVTDDKMHHLYVVSKAINNNKDNEDIVLYFLRFLGK